MLAQLRASVVHSGSILKLALLLGWCLSHRAHPELHNRHLKHHENKISRI